MTAEEAPVSKDSVSEALSMGNLLGGIGADMRHLKETGDRTLAAIDTVAKQQSVQGQAIAVLQTDMTNVKADMLKVLNAPAPEASVPPAVLTDIATLKSDHTALAAIVAAVQAASVNSQLSWPKLLTGAGVVVATAVAFNLIPSR